MTTRSRHLLIFAAGIVAAASANISPASSMSPTTSHVVATASTPITIEIVPDVFAPPTPDEIEDFVARAPQFVA